MTEVPRLEPHPEGGGFAEVFRSVTCVHTPDGRRRSALTHIYFRLAAGEVSRFHRVASDEVWNLYHGRGLRLVMWDGTADRVDEVVLAPEREAFCHIVPAGTWQAAEPIGGTVLVGCSVAPGFEFDDFELLREQSEAGIRLRRMGDRWKRFVSGCRRSP